MIIGRSTYSYRAYSASERPKGLFEFTVTGRGLFPVDMLRYDACWPADGESAAAMLDRPGEYNPREPRAIRLQSHSEPTRERWASFMWSVGGNNG